MPTQVKAAKTTAARTSRAARALTISMNLITVPPSTGRAYRAGLRKGKCAIRASFQHIQRGGLIGEFLSKDNRAVRGGREGHWVVCAPLGGVPPLGVAELQTPFRRAGSRARPEARCDRRPVLRGVASALRARCEARVEGDSRFRGSRHGAAPLLLRLVGYRGTAGRQGGCALGRVRRSRISVGRPVRRGGNPRQRTGRGPWGRMPRRCRRLPRIGLRTARRVSRRRSRVRCGGARPVRGVRRGVSVRPGSR